jgi:DNA polymerase (family X)
MGGKAHGGKRISRETALSLYSEIVDQMPTVESVILCGSARRQKPTCGDLDIVVVPAQDSELADKLNEFFVRMFGYQKSGKPAKTGLFRGVQTEFYVATPDNYGTFKQMWTGSAYHNVSLRRKATKMGYSLSQYGLKCKNTGNVVEFKSEEDLYRALNTPFKKPEDR